ncbi:MAG: Ldh family oxidoreductase [Atribacterota bacterium]
MNNKSFRVSIKTLQSFMEDTFKELGLTEENARISADVLITANKRGIDSHGVGRLKPFYYDNIKAGKVSPKLEMEIVKNNPTTAVIDGHGGIGLVIAKKSMEMAIKKAREHGMGMVTVRDSNHYGIAGYYALMATEAGMIGITGTNTRSLVVPTFGVENILGTNPLTFGIPTDEEFPFVLDCSTTVTAMGKIELYEKLNKLLPEGWVADIQGKTVQDAKKAREGILKGTASLLPLGGQGEQNAGYKGYGYATVVEILSSALQDGDYLNVQSERGKKRFGNKAMGHFFMAIDVNTFNDLKKFKQNAGNILRALRSSKKAPGAKRIYTAGEKEYEIWLERKEKGVPINKKLQEQLLTIQKELGLNQYQFPFE